MMILIMALKAIWAPWFDFPMMVSLLRVIEVETCMRNIDMGDQFNSFILHHNI